MVEVWLAPIAFEGRNDSHTTILAAPSCHTCQDDSFEAPRQDEKGQRQNWHIAHLRVCGGSHICNIASSFP